jgi:hypothetical protein
MGSFFTKIADPSVGGTYMTLLNTLSNLGGTWPTSFILLAVDYFTDAPCSKFDLSGNSIKCSDSKSKEMCQSVGGKCNYITDGYYMVNFACFCFGLMTMVFYIKPTIKKLEGLPVRMWRLKKEKKA